MNPVYLTKTLIAASSNGIGSISTAATPVVTVNTSQLDTGRRIVFYSTADASSLTLTFTGYGEATTTTFSESVAGSTASGIAATTTSDFSQLTAVSASSNANIPILIGTSSVGGTPWQSVNTLISPVVVAAGLTFSTSANSMTASVEMSFDDPFQQINPNQSVPTVFASTTHVVAASTTSFGIVNSDGQVPVPFSAYRLTLTSSSSAAGSVKATILQAGIAG